MITYRIDAADGHGHRYRVALSIPAPQKRQRLSLPVWIPGSYLVREFARHLSDISATEDSRAVELTQLDKSSWVAATEGRGPLVVSYTVYAFDTSVRAAFLSAERGFFNGTSLCLRAEGHEAGIHRLELAGLPEGWRVATAMTPEQVDEAGVGSYQAQNYDELVDHPVELGRFWRGSFLARGVRHDFVVAGALPDFDGDRLLADAARVCDTEIAFWHGTERPPFERYVFLLNALEDGHGGLEHRASTALVAPRRDLPRPESAGDKAEPSEGYVSLLGLISHEYFHTWSVKRLRPRDFERYDYDRENYTRLLWFFEGFTSYYDDLFLRRSGLIDDARYLKLLARTVSTVAATPGRLTQSVAEASFDAWVKYYRGDENTPNATISYYAKGSLVALALDLTMRSEGQGTLDEVMRTLWERSAGGPIDEDDIAAALEAVGGRSFAGELEAWVHGRADLPLQALLQAAGVEWQVGTPTLAQRIGVRVSESPLTGVKVTHVLQGGLGEQAGLTPGDEILAVEGWRLRRLDDAQRVITSGGPAQVLVGRDQRVVSLSLALDAETAAVGGAVTLKPASKASESALALLRAWLSG